MHIQHALASFLFSYCIYLLENCLPPVLPPSAAIRFFNKVAEVAEAEGHHPDLHLRNYRSVKPFFVDASMAFVALSGKAGAHGKGAETVRFMCIQNNWMGWGCLGGVPTIPHDLNTKDLLRCIMELDKDGRHISHRHACPSLPAALLAREVEVVVSTHAAGGLTLYDFILAAKLDQIEVDYSPKWLEKQMAAKQAATAKQAA